MLTQASVFKRRDNSESEGVMASVSACHGVVAQQLRRERNLKPGKGAPTPVRVKKENGTQGTCDDSTDLSRVVYTQGDVADAAPTWALLHFRPASRALNSALLCRIRASSRRYTSNPQSEESFYGGQRSISVVIF